MFFGLKSSLNIGPVGVAARDRRKKLESHMASSSILISNLGSVEVAVCNSSNILISNLGLVGESCCECVCNWYYYY